MRYDVHNYSCQDSCILHDVPMLTLIQMDLVRTEWMQDAVINLRVGDEQISDNDNLYIKRIS